MHSLCQWAELKRGVIHLVPPALVAQERSLGASVHQSWCSGPLISCSWLRALNLICHLTWCLSSLQVCISPPTMVLMLLRLPRGCYLHNKNVQLQNAPFCLQIPPSKGISTKLDAPSAGDKAAAKYFDSSAFLGENLLNRLSGGPEIFF